jgi:hypothetical protein
MGMAFHMENLLSKPINCGSGSTDGRFIQAAGGGLWQPNGLSLAITGDLKLPGSEATPWFTTNLPGNEGGQLGIGPSTSSFAPALIHNNCPNCGPTCISGIRPTG